MKIVGYVVVNPAHPDYSVAALSEPDGGVYAEKINADAAAEALREEHRNPAITVWGVVPL